MDKVCKIVIFVGLNGRVDDNNGWGVVVKDLGEWEVSLIRVW